MTESLKLCYFAADFELIYHLNSSMSSQNSNQRLWAAFASETIIKMPTVTLNQLNKISLPAI
jgi:hypothetical protein